MLKKYNRPKIRICLTYFNRGRTLIELMIALALSTLLVASIGTVIVVNSSVIRTLSVDANLEQRGYNTLKLITYDLEQAGFIINPPENNPFWTWNTGNGFSGLGSAPQPVFQQDASSANVSQMIRQVGLDSDYAISGVSQFINCQGRRVSFDASSSANLAATTRFFIDNHQLNCETSSRTASTATVIWSHTVIAENVTGLTMRYLTPSTLLTESPTANTTWQWRTIALMTDANLWNQVVAVEVCVEIREELLSSLGAQNNTYEDCNNSNTTPARGEVRRVFRDIVPLKNVLSTGAGYAN